MLLKCIPKLFPLKSTFFCWTRCLAGNLGRAGSAIRSVVFDLAFSLDPRGFLLPGRPRRAARSAHRPGVFRCFSWPQPGCFQWRSSHPPAGTPCRAFTSAAKAVCNRMKLLRLIRSLNPVGGGPGFRISPSRPSPTSRTPTGCSIPGSSAPILSSTSRSGPTGWFSPVLPCPLCRPPRCGYLRWPWGRP